MKKRMKRHGGQGTLELLIGSSVLVTFLWIGGPIAYFGFTKLWVRHCAYESLICVLEGSSANHCEKALETQLTDILKIGQLQKSWIRKKGKSVSSRVEFRTSERYLVIEGVTLTDPRVGGGFL